MEKLLLDLQKTVHDFDTSQNKGFKANYCIWNKSYTNVLCQIIVTHMPDKVTRDKFILLDSQLDICDEISYFIDDIVTSYYKLS